MGLTSFAVVVAFLSTFANADFSSLYNKNCPDFARTLGKSCSINNDCTEMKCQEKSLGDKALSLIIKINKCENPVSVDITITALGFSWKTTFQSSQKVAVQGLSIKPFGSLIAAGVYLQVVVKDTGSNLQLKIIILTGIELLGKFTEFTRDTLANSDLPVGTHECGLVHNWWKSLGDLRYLVVAGGIIFLIIVIVFFWWCCYKKPILRRGAATRNHNITLPMHKC